LVWFFLSELAGGDHAGSDGESGDSQESPQKRGDRAVVLPAVVVPYGCSRAGRRYDAPQVAGLFVGGVHVVGFFIVVVGV